jgi:hypothetical protein
MLRTSRSAVVVVALAAGSGACKRHGTAGEPGPPPAVAAATPKEFIGELSVAINYKNHTWGPFQARRGVQVPFEGFWQRYEPFVGIPISELVLAPPPRPDPVLPNGKLYEFRQVHAGYPVAGYGYQLQAVDGAVRSGLGKAMTGLPDQLPPPIAAERALAIALEQVEPKGARPWLTDPKRWRAPTSALVLWPSKLDPVGADFRLVYSFGFSGTGVREPGTLTIDGATGAVLTRTPGAVH